MKVAVVLPTYNERAVIGDLVREILEAVPAGDVLVVDDDSPDRTWALVEETFAGNDRVRVLRRIGRRGLPSALAEGIAATAGEVVVWLDADGSMPPAVIPQLTSGTTGADLVIASRYAPGGADVRGSRGRILASRVINGLGTVCLGRSVRDWTSGFVAVRRDVFERVPLRTHYAYGDYFIDFAYRVVRAGFRVREIPYRCVERRAGETKTSPDVGRFLSLGLHYAVTIVKLRWMSLTERSVP